MLYFYLGLCVYGGDPGRALTVIVESVWSLTSLTNDPILNFLIGAVVVIVGLCVAVGVLVVGFWLMIAAMALGLLAAIIGGLYSLSQVSITGAVIATLVAGTAMFFLVRRLGPRVKPYLMRALEPLFGVFIEWWIRPLLLRRKENKLMRKMKSSKETLVVEYQKLQLKHPEIATIPLATSYDGWLSQAYQRFQTRQVGKTLAEQAKTVEAQTTVFERVKQLYREYAAAADAYDDMKNLESRFREKREEEEIRRHERKKRLLTLKKEIREITARPKPAPPVAPHDPVKEEIDRKTREIKTMVGLTAAEEDMVREHPEFEKEIRRTFRKRREELQEAM